VKRRNYSRILTSEEANITVLLPGESAWKGENSELIYAGGRQIGNK
jgi:hypothetical protein